MKRTQDTDNGQNGGIVEYTNAVTEQKPRTEYQPKTGAKCGCRRGVQRDNCPACEGTGWLIDFVKIRESGRA